MNDVAEKLMDSLVALVKAGPTIGTWDLPPRDEDEMRRELKERLIALIDERIQEALTGSFDARTVEVRQ